LQWLQSQNLIPLLLEKLSTEQESSTQTSAGDLIKAIITISANATAQDNNVIGPNELTRQLVSEECVKTLIKDMLKGGNALTVGVGIVIEVIRKNNSDYDLENQIGPVPKSTDPIYLGTLLRQFALHIPDFMNLIKNAGSTSKELKVASGGKIESLGFDRFKTCELMAELLHCSNMILLNQRGAEAEVTQRDVERAKLKAEGKLTGYSDHPHDTGSLQDFGTSVDSSGFHHARAPSFGEGAEGKRLEVSNSTDEEFETVNADNIDDDVKVELEEHEVGDKKEEHSPPAEKQNSIQDEVTQQLEELTINIESNLKPASEAAKGTVSPIGHPEDKPAPLFFAKKEKDTSEPAPTAESQLDPNPPPEEIDQPYEVDVDGTPVVGDLLKIKFVENHVVPTIFDFFFRFPWNNFLHNVVYDVIQQVFNGQMERGYNRCLAMDVFEPARITERIIEGQEASDKMSAQKNMRLGYMGHLTLIAEEVVKFAERTPPETLSEGVLQKVTAPEWIEYVENTLAETRERDNAILGGVRPDTSLGNRQAVLNAINMGGGSLGGGGGLSGSGYGGNSTLGLDTVDLSGANSGSGGSGLGPGVTATGGGSSLLFSGTSLMSGFGSSDEEDDELDEGILGGVGESTKGPSGLLDDSEQVGEVSFDDIDMSY
jgi:SIT4-associating protein SAP185/190